MAAQQSVAKEVAAVKEVATNGVSGIGSEVVKQTDLKVDVKPDVLKTEVLKTNDKVKSGQKVDTSVSKISQKVDDVKTQVKETIKDEVKTSGDKKIIEQNKEVSEDVVIRKVKDAKDDKDGYVVLSSAHTTVTSPGATSSSYNYTYSPSSSQSSAYSPSYSQSYSPYSRSSVNYRSGADSVRRSYQEPAHLELGPKVFAQRNSSVQETAKERKEEKTDLQNLNGRLATYIEKVRYLEAYNKALVDEIEKLRNTKIANGERLKQLYEEKLVKGQEALRGLEGQLSSADVTILGLQDHLKDSIAQTDATNKIVSDLKSRNVDLVNEVGDHQGEITRLTDRCGVYEVEVNNHRDTIRRVQDDMGTVKSDLDSETLRHLAAENRAAELDNQLEFITNTYEQEIADLKALLAEGRGDAEVKEYWHGELSKAINDIQTDYDSRLDAITRDMHTQMTLNVQTMRENASRAESSTPYLKEELSKQKEKSSALSSSIMDLQSENAKLRAQSSSLESRMRQMGIDSEEEKARMSADMKRLQGELETVLYELQTLMNAKLSMQMEIATYKKLLEYEEVRVVDYSELELKSEEKQVVNLQDVINEQRHAVGDLVFNEATVDGRYVSIKNRAKGKTHNLKGWSIIRIGSIGKKLVYTFGDVKIAPFETIKVWGSGTDTKIRTLKDGLVADFESWGTGNSDTYLTNPERKETSRIQLSIN